MQKICICLFFLQHPSLISIDGKVLQLPRIILRWRFFFSTKLHSVFEKNHVERKRYDIRSVSDGIVSTQRMPDILIQFSGMPSDGPFAQLVRRFRGSAFLPYRARLSRPECFKGRSKTQFDVLRKIKASSQNDRTFRRLIKITFIFPSFDASKPTMQVVTIKIRWFESDEPLLMPIWRTATTPYWFLCVN